jgi:membrane protein
MKPLGAPPPTRIASPAKGSARARLRRLVVFVERVGRRFFAQRMPVYAAALAYRGLLALVPFALLSLSLIGLVGIEGSLPRITAALIRLRGNRGDDGATTEVPLEGLLSIGVVVGLWSMSVGARLFMQALNAVHGVEETRTPLARAVASVIFLPALAAVTVVATVLLVVTSKILATIAYWIGLASVFEFLGSWVRAPLALAVIGCAVAASYRFGPSVRPPVRAVAAGAGVAVALWTAASLAFGFALSTVLDYGSTYGGLGAAVALLVYLHLTAIILLVGAQVSAVVAPAERRLPAPEPRAPSTPGRSPGDASA